MQEHFYKWPLSSLPLQTAPLEHTVCVQQDNDPTLHLDIVGLQTAPLEHTVRVQQDDAPPLALGLPRRQQEDFQAILR